MHSHTLTHTFAAINEKKNFTFVLDYYVSRMDRISLKQLDYL